MTYAVALALMCALLLARPAPCAERITIDAEDVPFEAVIKMLEAQSGYQFRLIGGARRRQQEKVTLKAENRPIKEVLRAACEQVGFRYRLLHGNTFWIEEGEFQESPHAQRVEAWRVSVESLRVSHGGRYCDFIREPKTYSQQKPSMTIQFAIEADTSGDGAMLCGLEGVEIVDDTGRTYPLPDAMVRPFRQTLQFRQRSDKVTHSLHLPEPAANAKTLTLGCALTLYTRAEPLEFRFDDLKAEDTAQKKDDIEVTLLSAAIKERSCNLRVKISGFPRMRHDEDNPWTRLTVVLLDADNREYRVGSISTHNTTWSSSTSVPENFTPVALVFRISKRGGPIKTLDFKIENIPLPAAPEPNGKAPP